jgi:predicted transcriptional regulator
VREFVNDVPRAKVLSVKTVTVYGQPVDGGRTVVSTAKIETIIPMLLERDEPITVVDANNQVIGVVNRHSVAAILQAEQR